MAVSKEIDAWLRDDVSATDDSTTSSDAMTSRSRRFRYRVLLADADEALLVKLAARLANEGYDVRTARDGFEALALMREAMPDLLVSDLRMPNMSGFELLSVVRKRFPGMAVITCTGEFAAAGNPLLLSDRFIEKGGNFTSKLLEAIPELLSQSPLRTQPAWAAVAPAWFPRSINGYFVLTCSECLRSFSVMTRTAQIGKQASVRCSHCGVDVNYYIEDSLLPIQTDLTKLMQYRDARIDGGQGTPRGTKQHPAAQKSPRKFKVESEN